MIGRHVWETSWLGGYHGWRCELCAKQVGRSPRSRPSAAGCTAWDHPDPDPPPDRAAVAEILYRIRTRDERGWVVRLLARHCRVIREDLIWWVVCAGIPEGAARRIVAATRRSGGVVLERSEATAVCVRAAKAAKQADRKSVV